jgi:HEAT repeat protein
MDTVPSLIAELGHEEPEVRNHAAIALRDLGPAAASAIQALIATLADDDLSVRGATVQALEAIGVAAKAAVEPLLEVAAGDPCLFVRASALQALAVIAPRDIRLMMNLAYLLHPPLVRKCAPRAMELLRTFP